ncbi:MAG TPA: hypothetical protein VGG74_03760 [Kofleriaceae bacterium]
MRWLVLALAACGDNAASPIDAASVDAALVDSTHAVLCDAVFGGNFSLSEQLPADCAMLSNGSGGTTLSIDVAAPPIGSDVAIQIVLGQPSPGAYSSETVTQWTATSTQVMSGASRCYYVAGADSTPPGTFAMTLSAVGSATAHGRLSLELAVLAEAGTNCGSDNLESLQLEF